MALVLLRRFSHSIEASIARSLLLSAGIRTYVFDTENEWNTVFMPIPLRLMVAEEDLAEAAAILAEVDRKRVSPATPGSGVG